MTQSDQWALLAVGALRLDQLPPPAFEFYTLGYHDGRLSLAGELMQLEHECDRLYALLHNPQAPRRIAAQLLERHQILARRGAA